MKDFFTESTYFGVVVSLVAFEIGRFLQKRLKLPLFNPILIGMVLIIGLLLALGVEYDSYYNGAKYISYLLTPATICLAVPLYEQLALLRKNVMALAAGIVAGVLANFVTILVLAKLFGLDTFQFATLLPKSITTAIGMGVSESLGGTVAVTVAAIIVTGTVGNMFAESLFRLIRIREPIAKGLALGTAAHAIGTAKAMEIGEVEGAMSSLALTVCGLLTAVVASFLVRAY